MNNWLVVTLHLSGNGRMYMGSLKSGVDAKELFGQIAAKNDSG